MWLAGSLRGALRPPLGRSLSRLSSPAFRGALPRAVAGALAVDAGSLPGIGRSVAGRGGVCAAAGDARRPRGSPPPSRGVASPAAPARPAPRGSSVRGGATGGCGPPAAVGGFRSRLWFSSGGGNGGVCGEGRGGGGGGGDAGGSGGVPGPLEPAILPDGSVRYVVEIVSGRVRGSGGPLPAVVQLFGEDGSMSEPLFVEPSALPAGESGASSREGGASRSWDILAHGPAAVAGDVGLHRGGSPRRDPGPSPEGYQRALRGRYLVVADEPLGELKRVSIQLDAAASAELEARRRAAAAAARESGDDPPSADDLRWFLDRVEIRGPGPEGPWTFPCGAWLDGAAAAAAAQERNLAPAVLDLSSQLAQAHYVPERRPLRVRLGAATQPHPAKVAMGERAVVGRAEGRGGEDAYFLVRQGEAPAQRVAALGVADGVAQWRREGIDAGRFSREVVGVWRREVLAGNTDALEILRQAEAHVREEWAEHRAWETDHPKEAEREEEREEREERARAQNRNTNWSDIQEETEEAKEEEEKKGDDKGGEEKKGDDKGQEKRSGAAKGQEKRSGSAKEDEGDGEPDAKAVEAASSGRGRLPSPPSVPPPPGAYPDAPPEGRFPPYPPPPGYGPVPPPKGSCTACVIVLDGAAGRLHAALLGDSGYALVGFRAPASGDPEGSSGYATPGEPGDAMAVKYRSPQQEHAFGFPFQLGHDAARSDRADDALLSTAPLAHGDVVVAGSDGLFDNLDDDAIASIVKREIDRAGGIAGGAANAAPTLARALLAAAFEISLDAEGDTPYSRAASEHFDLVYSGGKKDDITVLVAIVE